MKPLILNPVWWIRIFPGYIINRIFFTCLTGLLVTGVQAQCPNTATGQTEWYCSSNTFSLGVATASQSSYSWFKDGLRIAGPFDGDGNPKSFSYSINDINQSSTSGRYSVVQEKTGCPSTEILIKNIYWITSPVDVITTTNITPYAVSFNWSSAGTGAQYKYEVTTNNTPSGSGTATILTSATVKSLLPNTVYYIHIGPSCDFGFINDWTTISFLTLKATVLCPGGSSTMTSTTYAGYSYQWQVSHNGGAFTNISNVAPYSTATTATLTLTNPSTSLYGNIYQCIATKSASPTFTSNPNELFFSSNWNGSGGTGWNTAGSWSCGNIPDGNTDVIIPSVANKPVITGTVNVRSITTSAGTITVSTNAKLNITGPPQ